MIAFRCQYNPTLKDIDNSAEYVVHMGNTSIAGVYPEGIRNYYTYITHNIYVGKSITNLSNMYSDTTINNYVELNNAVNLFYTFSLCQQFNQPVNIVKAVDMNGTFNACYNFNQTVNIPNTVINMCNTFNACHNFNQPLIMPDSVTNATGILNRAHNFNSNVVIGANVQSLDGAFSYCVNMKNPNIDFSKLNVPCRMYNMFYGCTNFNAPIVINKCSWAERMFQGCSNFNSPIIIEMLSNYDISCVYMFLNATSFNSMVSITINEAYRTRLNTAGFSSMFSGLRNFNSPVQIPRLNNYKGYFDNMFTSCVNFNQPISDMFGDYTRDVSGMFAYCTSFNQNVIIPDSYNQYNCKNMLYQCTNFNGEIILGNGANNCAYMMYNCQNFNHDITLPNTVMNASSMLCNCTNFGKNIYFKGNSYRALDVSHLLYGTTFSIRKNVHFNQVLNNRFNMTNKSQSLQGGISDIIWTSMTNGFYNDFYNIYCYYNYPG